MQPDVESSKDPSVFDRSRPVSSDSSESLHDLGVETVAAERVEAAVIGHAVEDRAVQGSQDANQHEKNVLNEFKAISRMLRDQSDSEDDTQGQARPRVTQAVMRNRLTDLKQKLQELRNVRQGSSASTSQPVPTDDAIGSDDEAEQDTEKALLGGELVETERERMIRNGLITPFDALQGLDRQVRRPAAAPSQTSSALREIDLGATPAMRLASSAVRVRKQNEADAAARRSTKLLSFNDMPKGVEESCDVGRKPFTMSRAPVQSSARAKKRKRTLDASKSTVKAARQKVSLIAAKRQLERDAYDEADNSDDSADEAVAGLEEAGIDGSDADEDVRSAADGDDYDDADEYWYKERLEKWNATQAGLANANARKKYRNRAQARSSHRQDAASDAAESAVAQPEASGEPSSRPDEDLSEDDAPQADTDISFDGGYRIPTAIYDALFPYQQVGVKWMWELYTHRAGGIIGDEMGLGKTVQVAAFLAGLHHSKRFRPTLIVAPVTTLKQWQRELRTWYPPFRVVVLHDTGRSPPVCSRPSRDELIEIATQSESGILLTTYEQLRINADQLLPFRWGHVILDEGHKIRNPDANITLVCKQVRTVHRCIMSGSPIQNSLSELWSLFDFVFPGKLGTLPVFQAQFAVPIAQGGYSNASAVAVSTAYKCAVMLRDLISPYLLRRQKADVAKQLPEKNEQVLFCKLTHAQRKVYRGYLASRDVADILAGKRHSLEGITVLRKICNHADLLERAQMQDQEDYGNPERSGKLSVTLKVLDMWQQQGHKALLFTQTQQMLDIIEQQVQARGFAYHRMDGNTAVSLRYRMMDDFNNNDKVFVFLLTTKVGGIGINLTGANRVLLFDPDWNPSTDMQARERCWRLGQKRNVTIFRLITRGTIEEKVYHRQIYKQYLTNRILIDPRQKRFLASKDIHDLFTLTDHRDDGTETGKIFSAVDCEMLADDVPVVNDSEDSEAEAAVEGSARHRHRSAVGDVQQAGTSGRESHEKLERTSTQAGKRSAKKKSKKRRKPNEADVAGADGLEEDVVAEQHDRDRAARLKQDAAGDASILRELFEGKGLHSALNHHAIESANDAVKMNAERTASKVAETAVQAVKQSRQDVQQAPVHLYDPAPCLPEVLAWPTWTGRHGQSGAPGRRFGAVSNRSGASCTTTASAPFSGVSTSGQGLSSQQLFAKLRGTAQAAECMSEEQRAKLWTTEVVKYLQRQDGNKAQSNDIVSHFGNSVTSETTALFRQVLKRVAVLKKRNGASSYWVLRPDFA